MISIKISIYLLSGSKNSFLKIFKINYKNLQFDIKVESDL